MKAWKRTNNKPVRIKIGIELWKAHTEKIINKSTIDRIS